MSRVAGANKGGKVLADLGEGRLVDRISRVCHSFAAARGVRLGVGDDAALLRPAPRHDLVVSCDELVEDVHFRWATQSPRTVGRRALLVSLSDLSAMGARPLGCTLALSAPANLSLACFDALLEGLATEGAAQGCPLVGGNLSRGACTQLALTVLGEVRRDHALRRDALRPGDGLFVSGTLGGAALALARSERRGSSLTRLPESRVDVGLALGRRRDRGACIDLSDGLVSDLGQLLRASRCAADVDIASLPLAPRLASACRSLGIDPDETALGAGEDYELLFSLRRGGPSASLLSRQLGARVTRIGRATRGSGMRGLPPLTSTGFRHF